MFGPANVPSTQAYQEWRKDNKAKGLCVSCGQSPISTENKHDFCEQCYEGIFDRWCTQMDRCTNNGIMITEYRRVIECPKCKNKEIESNGGVVPDKTFVLNCMNCKNIWYHKLPRYDPYYHREVDYQ